MSTIFSNNIFTQSPEIPATRCTSFFWALTKKGGWKKIETTQAWLALFWPWMALCCKAKQHAAILREICETELKRLSGYFFTLRIYHLSWQMSLQPVLKGNLTDSSISPCNLLWHFTALLEEHSSSWSQFLNLVFPVLENSRCRKLFYLPSCS